MTIATLVGQQNFRRPPFCKHETSVFDAAARIAAQDVNALAVVENDKLIGIITDHDIIRCLADTGPDFYAQTVGDWMTRDPITCTSETSLTAALRKMALRGIRHLPVLKEGHPLTVVSSKELLSNIHENDALEISVLRDMARSHQVSQT